MLAETNSIKIKNEKFVLFTNIYEDMINYSLLIMQYFFIHHI